jgi:hypothetical protein
MAISYPALKTEIETDPNSYGYAAHVTSGSTQAIADLLNLARTGSNGGPAITVRRTNIAASEVLEAIDNRDFEASLNAAHVAWFESVTQLPMLRLVNDDGSDTRILGNLKRFVQNPGPQGSRARLIAIADRAGSRAEQLFGSGTTVQSSDIAQALAS